MRIAEVASTAWARRKNANVRKYRCTSGPRKGRVMSSPAACNAPINYKKKFTLAKTKSLKSPAIKNKTRLTKKQNMASRRLGVLNR